MAEKDPEERLGTHEKATCAREIREALGARLLAYYEDMQNIPVPNHLTDLIEHLAERTRQTDRNTDNHD